jgi:selenocysteine lyase/cysteine desulfurase
VFARNATEAINLVAYSWGRRNVGRGDQIILTEMEHHANLVPWQLLVQEVDGDLEFIPITDDGVLRLDVFEVLLRLKPKLVAFTHVSNTLGTINPVKEMTEMAHAAGALVLVDGAQAVPHLKVDVQELGVDFYAFSGHKMLAPMGSGALWARRELLDSMPPFLAGGEMIREVHLRRSEFNEVPWKFEAGTPAVADAIGLGVAADYLMDIGMDGVREHERALVAYALEVLPRSRRSSCTARSTRTPAAASSRSTCPVSTRTTWPRSWTATASPSEPVTTARCRSMNGSTSRPPPAPRSTSTRRPMTSTPSRAASTRSSGSSTGSRPARPRG